MVRLTRAKPPQGTPLAAAVAAGNSATQRLFVGCFEDEVAAAKAHDAAALEAYGDAAVLNFHSPGGPGSQADLGPQPSHFRGVVQAGPEPGAGWRVQLPQGSDVPPSHAEALQRVFPSAAEAARLYDEVLRAGGQEVGLNFPSRSQLVAAGRREYPTGQVLPALLSASNVKAPPSATAFVGVERVGSWYRARVRVDGVAVQIGRFASGAEAAKARDAAALEYLGADAVLNFPVGQYAHLTEQLLRKGRLSEEGLEALRASSDAAGRPRKTSLFRGVQWSHHHDGWRARVSFRSKLHLLGTHETELAACAARDAKCMELGVPAKRLNFSPAFYDSALFLQALAVDMFRAQHGGHERLEEQVGDADDLDYVTLASHLQGLPQGPACFAEAERVALPTIKVAAQYLLAQELASDAPTAQVQSAEPVSRA